MPRKQPDPQDTAEDPPIGGSSPSGEVTPPARTRYEHSPSAIAAGSAHAGSPIRYESRISIVEAFQYQGNLSQAPAWIDRNWIGFADEDPVRGLPAGPCLRVPRSLDPSTHTVDEVVLARIGDYVAQQSVQGDLGTLPTIRIEVWAQEQFEKLFIPSAMQASVPIQGQAAMSTRPVTLSMEDVSRAVAESS